MTAPTAIEAIERLEARMKRRADQDWSYFVSGGEGADLRTVLSALSDLQGERDRLREAIRSAEPMLETLHSVVVAPDVRKSVWAVIKQARAALSPTPPAKDQSNDR